MLGAGRECQVPGPSSTPKKKKQFTDPGCLFFRGDYHAWKKKPLPPPACFGFRVYIVGGGICIAVRWSKELWLSAYKALVTACRNI